MGLAWLVLAWKQRGKFKEFWVSGKKPWKSKQTFSGMFKDLNFFSPLFSTGSASQNDNDKPVAHVVGKLSEQGLWDTEGEDVGLLWAES